MMNASRHSTDMPAETASTDSISLTADIQSRMLFLRHRRRRRVQGGLCGRPMMRRSPKNILLESSSSREVFLRWLVFVMLMALFFSTASFNDDSTFTNHNGWNAGIPTIAIVVTAFQPPTVVARRSYHSQQQQAHWYKREEQMQALFSTTRLSSDKISAGDDSYNDEPARTAIVDTNTNANTNINADLGEFDPSTKIEVKNPDKLNVGNPQQKVLEKEFSVNAILKELAAIQQQGPQKYCILGTRHCSYLHQQIIELLAYALVLSGNHVYTSGASGTNAATIRGALRAERHDLLTVVIPQSRSKQTLESQDLLQQVYDVIEMPQNDDLSLDIASRICNSYLLSLTDQLISFAFHESSTVIEATKEAKKLDMLVTVLYLD